MERREFLRAGAAVVGGSLCSLAATGRGWGTPRRERRFHLHYAPHFGMFKHSAGGDLVRQIEFAADQGFTAWEDLRLAERPVEVQQRIARVLASRDMQLGAFDASPSFREIEFGRSSQEAETRVLDEVQRSLVVAGRVHATCLAVVPGRCVEGMAWEPQAVRCVQLLRRCCDLVEPHGLQLVLEPWRGCEDADLGGPLVRSLPQALPICRAVGSPACKILFDVYDVQASGACALQSLSAAWPEIGYVQFGDHPGRKEPGTGPSDARRVFGFLAAQGYAGVVGMEHGNSRPGAAGERAVIEAYAVADRS